MSNSRDVQGEFKLVEAIMLDNLNFFAMHGLSYVGLNIEHSELTEDTAVFGFRNSSNGIGVEVGFFPGLRDLKRSFSVYITNACGQNLNVREYLRIHNRQDLLDQFIDQGTDTTIRTFCANFLEALASLFSTQLKKIVDGTDWEIVPFNWKGYR
jgi:hypothetical protein